MVNGGSSMAGPIWVNTMRQALEGTPNRPFVQPSGIIQKPVCYSNGGLASASGNGTYNEFFLASALPTATCSPTAEKKVEDKPKETPDPVDMTDDESPTGSGDDDTPIIDTGDDDTTPDDSTDDDPTPIVPPILRP